MKGGADHFLSILCGSGDFKFSAQFVFKVATPVRTAPPSRETRRASWLLRFRLGPVRGFVPLHLSIEMDPTVVGYAGEVIPCCMAYLMSSAFFDTPNSSLILIL